MRQSIFRVFLLLCLASCCVCLHDIVDLSGWKAIPLDSKEAKDSMLKAAEHIKGKLLKPITAFQWTEDVPSWDLYRVSFTASFTDGSKQECHSDVLWKKNPSTVVVFNTGCVSVDKLYVVATA